MANLSRKITEIFMQKMTRSIRFLTQTIKAATDLGLDINEIARKSVEQAVIAKSNQCPVCGAKVKPKKP